MRFRDESKGLYRRFAFLVGTERVTIRLGRRVWTWPRG